MMYPFHQTNKFIINNKKNIYDVKNNLIIQITDIICKNKINCKLMIHAFDTKKIFIINIINICDKYIKGIDDDNIDYYIYIKNNQNNIIDLNQKNINNTQYINYLRINNLKIKKIREIVC